MNEDKATSGDGTRYRTLRIDKTGGRVEIITKFKSLLNYISLYD
jgi:hypothetical protein